MMEENECRFSTVAMLSFHDDVCIYVIDQSKLMAPDNDKSLMDFYQRVDAMRNQ